MIGETLDCLGVLYIRGRILKNGWYAKIWITGIW